MVDQTDLTLDVMAARTREYLGTTLATWIAEGLPIELVSYALTGLSRGPARDAALADILARLAPGAAPGGEGVLSIYMASKAIHGPRWRELREGGWPIISTWIDEAESGRTTDWQDLWDRCAARAAVTIVYREKGEELKGALVEAGAALSHGQDVILVGPFDHTRTKHRRVRRAANLDTALSLAKLIVDRARLAQPAPASGTDVEALRVAADVRECLLRLKSECEVEGLDAKAGFDAWCSWANKLLGTSPLRPVTMAEIFDTGTSGGEGAK